MQSELHSDDEEEESIFSHARRGGEMEDDHEEDDETQGILREHRSDMLSEGEEYQPPVQDSEYKQVIESYCLSTCTIIGHLLITLACLYLTSQNLLKQNITYGGTAVATLSLLVSTFISLLLVVVVGDSAENLMLSDEPSIGLLAKVLEFIEFSASTLLIVRITVFLKLVLNERSKRYAKS